MSVSEETEKPSRTCAKQGCERGGKLTRGMCARCYRYWLDHTPKEERSPLPSSIDDFWQQVEKTHEWGCWVWGGPSNHQGYGMWRNKYLAHRESWKRDRGPIDLGLLVLHICDQKSCVNPKHLYLGTHVENGIDAHVRGRMPDQRKQFCPKGHAKEGENLLAIRSKGRVEHRCRRCENERKNEAVKRARRARGLQKTRLNFEEKARIWELSQGGMPQRKIAVEVGRSLSAVQQAITEVRASGDH